MKPVLSLVRLRWAYFLRIELPRDAGRVRIRIEDATGAAVTEAQGSVLDRAGKPTRTVQANTAGEIVLGGRQWEIVGLKSRQRAS